MSCPNFETQSWFPLFVIDEDRYSYRTCDECCENFGEDEEVCPYCGNALFDVIFDYDLCYWDCKAIMSELDKENDNLSFFEIRIQDGHWRDGQLIVNLTKYADCCGFDIDGNTSYVDNENTRYYFDCCRSECIRRFNVEHNKVLKIMKKIADEWSMEELECVGVFSNGEAVYTTAKKERKVS